MPFYFGYVHEDQTFELAIDSTGIKYTVYSSGEQDREKKLLDLSSRIGKLTVIQAPHLSKNAIWSASLEQGPIIML